MKKFYITLATFFLFTPVFSQTPPSININTKTSNILYNDTLLLMEIYDVTTLLGEPDRREMIRHTRQITEQNSDGDIGHSYETIEADDEYLIYDSLGIIFCTENNDGPSGKLSRMIVFFNHDREFTNRTLCEFEPDNIYRGTVFLNGEKFYENKQLIPYQVNPSTETFPLFNMTFSPTSYKTDIDMIYSRKANLYVEFYIDNPMDRRAASMVIKPTR